ncbi:MAG: glycoside hydrolase family 73 protein [Bacteroidia bacterium]
MNMLLTISLAQALIAFQPSPPPDSQVKEKLPIELIMEQTIETDEETAEALENAESGVSIQSVAVLTESDAYIRRYARTAVEEMNRYNIPASITLAQAILESNKGKSNLARLHNNHFGLTCAKCTTDSVLYLDRLSNEMRYFQKFPNVWAGFRSHSIRIAGNDRYKECFSAQDYAEFAKALQKCGYAEDANYAEKLISIIENYQLNRYDTVEKVVWEEDLLNPNPHKKKKRK